jgi:hypothetical protein
MLHLAKYAHVRASCPSQELPETAITVSFQGPDSALINPSDPAAYTQVHSIALQMSVNCREGSNSRGDVHWGAFAMLQCFVDREWRRRMPVAHHNPGRMLGTPDRKRT